MIERALASAADVSIYDDIVAPSEEISRPTEELVIGMVGAVGAGVSRTSDIIRKFLEEDYGYTVRIIKASDIILENAPKSGIAVSTESGADRIKMLQAIGTELRKKFKEDYIAAKAIEKIAVSRKASEKGYTKTATVPQPNSLRHATIIDSLKHPDESKLLRRVYGGMYWQFTVFAPESVRDHRLRTLGVEKDRLSGIFTRDENDNEGDHGQKVSKTAYQSDFFIRNDGENDIRLRGVVERFLEIIFNISVHTPTKLEAGMYAAVSAANKSACLSRQVGAAIYSSTDELIGVGWNDVPRANGGLYSSEDAEGDHRCFKWGDRVCHNDRKKAELYKKVFSELKRNNLLSSSVTESDIIVSLSKTPVKDLIEYSRSIHAEMEAIVSAARSGKLGMVGGTLFTTTFPCHNCARHIVAAGISRVFYIEPYAKSLALELHGDSIADVEGGSNKVAFLQYEGVGPDSSSKLFRHGTERKAQGRAKVLDKRMAAPVLPPPMDGFTTHEKRVISRLVSVESGPVPE